MKTKKPFRTIRTTIPTSTYATIAYLAAEAGLTIGQFVQAAVIDSAAGKRPAFLDGVGVPPDRDPAPIGADGDIVEGLLG
ncbi:MAG: hypothetical protein JNL21_38635 [Myxococcales bacterium]|nr:hypothetical protein [Myxococcales bacterium]